MIFPVGPFRGWDSYGSRMKVDAADRFYRGTNKKKISFAKNS